jgi:hypothetical protein
LEQSSEHMARALSRSRVIITCQDLDLRYVWVFNPDVGYEDTVGKRMEEFADPRQVAAMAPMKRAVLTTARPLRRTVTMEIAGKRRTFDMTVTPTTEQGELVGLTTIAVELTDLLAAQEELHQAHARLLGMLGDRMIGGKVGSLPA